VLVKLGYYGPEIDDMELQKRYSEKYSSISGSPSFEDCKGGLLLEVKSRRNASAWQAAWQDLIKSGVVEIYDDTFIIVQSHPF
jgi:hypothetical protein